MSKLHTNDYLCLYASVMLIVKTVVALAMLMRRFNFQIAVGAPPVEMTTGATIHTTQGLKMTVTHRIKPPIVPSLQMSTMEVDPSISLSDQDEVSQKGEIYQAQS
ncbi:Protein LUTEIN DEFICIENT 5, chloroplastic [Glycine soja]